MRGGVFPASMPEARGARARSHAEPSMTGRDLAQRGHAARADPIDGDGDGPRIVAHRHRHQGLDRAQPRRARRDASSCTRARTTRRGAAGARRRRVLPRQRPRRPGRARLRRRHAARARRQAADRSASASATSCSAARSAWRRSSCPFGHRGANHPVKDLETGRDRDHVAEPRLRGPRARTASSASRPTSRCAGRPTSARPQLSHVNLYDRTVEGLTLLDVAGGTVQYHPEAGPGPARLAVPLRPLPGAGAPMPRRDDLHKILHPRLRPDRHRPGGRVRLLRRAGLQGAARGGLRGRARQLQPGDDHDRPGVRRRDLRRAAAARRRSRRSSRRSARTRCCRRSAARPR